MDINFESVEKTLRDQIARLEAAKPADINFEVSRSMAIVNVVDCLGRFVETFAEPVDEPDNRSDTLFENEEN